MNKRLGNTLFTTPLIDSLARGYPRARIDVMVQDPAHRCLLATLPGVGEVIHVPRSPVGLARCLLELRRERYDLAIDPTVNALSNRLALLLSRARYKLGFAGAEQWIRLTHAARVPTQEPHQARQAVRLLSDTVLPHAAEAGVWLSVRPGRTARAEARRALDEVLAASPLTPPEHAGGGALVGFFADATGAKQLPGRWWLDWTESMLSVRCPPRLVQILPPGSTTPLRPEVETVSFPALDRLAALLGMLDVFVAADSGPMHLAAAAGAPTIGLFRATDPRHYAPLGRHCLSLAGDALDAPYVAEWTRRLVHVTASGREHCDDKATSSCYPSGDRLTGAPRYLFDPGA